MASVAKPAWQNCIAGVHMVTATQDQSFSCLISLIIINILNDFALTVNTFVRHKCCGGDGSGQVGEKWRKLQKTLRALSE